MYYVSSVTLSTRHAMASPIKTPFLIGKDSDSIVLLGFLFDTAYFSWLLLPS
jgi:hypothetical protein